MGGQVVEQPVDPTVIAGIGTAGSLDELEQVTRSKHVELPQSGQPHSAPGLPSRVSRTVDLHQRIALLPELEQSSSELKANDDAVDGDRRLLNRFDAGRREGRSTVEGLVGELPEVGRVVGRREMTQTMHRSSGGRVGSSTRAIARPASLSRVDTSWREAAPTARIDRATARSSGPSTVRERLTRSVSANSTLPRSASWSMS